MIDLLLRPLSLIFSIHRDKTGEGNVVVPEAIFTLTLVSDTHTKTELIAVYKHLVLVLEVELVDICEGIGHHFRDLMR